MSIGGRLGIYIKYKEASRQEFCSSANIPYNSLTQILGGSRNMSSEILDKVLTYFPRLNSRWLITGKGPMEYTIDAYHIVEENITPEEINQVETVHLDKEELIPIYIGRSDLEKLVSELVRKEIKKL